MIRQANGVAMIHLTVLVAWMENWNSTGCRLTGELSKEHEPQGSFSEGTEISHIVGLRI